MLNVAFWACKYNDDIVCNDRSKRPCVLYLSQENDNHETLERTISYVKGLNDDGKALGTNEILANMVREKLRDGRWDLQIKYRPKNSISTGDIEGIINEVESEENVEVKIIIHDYIKRIKPDFPTGDLRIDIGEAINEFSTLSKARKIPVITANQLNREAYRVLEETSADGKKKMDVGNKITQAMISESNMLLENADFVAGINREYAVSTKSMWLTFKDLKNRADKNQTRITAGYFAHPFEPDNGMRLVEDYELKESASVDKIADTLGSFVMEDQDEEDELNEDSQGYINGGGIKKKPSAAPRNRVKTINLADEIGEEE